MTNFDKPKYIWPKFLKSYSTPHQMGIFFTIILLSACISNAETVQTQQDSSELNTTNNTVYYSFEGNVKRGEEFEKALPNDLFFKLEPIEYAYVGWMGWIIHIGQATELSHNYAGIVTPPFRGINTLQILGWHFRNADNTGPNDGSINAPQEERVFNFVLQEKDYQVASEALECILHPPLCKDLDVSEAFDLHQSVPKTSGTLLITQLELGNLKPEEQAWIETMEFEVELDLPQE